MSQDRYGLFRRTAGQDGHEEWKTYPNVHMDVSTTIYSFGHPRQASLHVHASAHDLTSVTCTCISNHQDMLLCCKPHNSNH